MLYFRFRLEADGRISEVTVGSVPSPASGEEWKRTFAANEENKEAVIHYAWVIFLPELR